MLVYAVDVFVCLFCFFFRVNFRYMYLRILNQIQLGKFAYNVSSVGLKKMQDILIFVLEILVI